MAVEPTRQMRVPGAGPIRSGPAARAALLALAVGVAFADSSIVVIALPEMLGDFTTTIPRVAWVITAYNLAVALVALALIPVMSRVSATLMTRVGLVLFSAACAVCAVAGSLGVLVAGRTVQGIGAALLLAGAVPLLVATVGSRRGGTRVWGAAAVVGAALGPATGGALTQVFDWRAIFIVQIPLALAALVATAPAGEVPVVHRATGPVQARATRWAAGASLALLSGALVGALFLAAVLVIDGWGYAPLFAAAVVSALPAGAAVGEPVARRSRPIAAMAGGTVIVAGSLLAMGLTLPSEPLYLAVTLALCGFGTGLAMPPLTRLSIEGPDPARSGTWSVGARHLGLVVGLLLMAPLLAASLDDVTERAVAVGTARVVDAPLPIASKLQIGRALEDALAATPPGSAPDLSGAVAGGDGSDATDRAVLGAALEQLVAPAITRGFRSSFLLCALLGLGALLPLALLREAHP
jgi:predicted MFS family arabinose efflux permease